MSEDTDMLAAELALGLLEGEEREAALRRQLHDPAFGAEVARWRDHFATLFPRIPAEEPSASLEEQVMRATLPSPANDARPWRFGTVAASAVALVLAGLLVFQSPEPAIPTGEPVVTASAPMMANFTIAGADAPRVGIYDGGAETLMMPGDMPIPEGHSAQLWAEIDGKAVALGTFDVVDGGVKARTTRHLPEGTVLMITFEPVGQAPTTPSGEVVAEGILTAV
ncbi:anti-sigma factor [Sphingomicrobium sp. XHP0235]|uniref:anti-sigma factor domain-containing protein n=1 Tax=Sphingomicrobium aquimarinum TaxID=3133971 RepID=UPI0031FEC0BB